MRIKAKMTEFKKILPKIIRLFNSLKKDGLIQGYALIGGMAIAARGFPRATKDLDFLINSDEDSFRTRLVKRIEATGYSLKVYKGDFDDPLRGLIRIFDVDKLPLIDIIFAYKKWQENIVDSAEELLLEDISVPVVKTEDLIVLKLKAGSARDLLDAEEIVKVAVSSKNLDKERLFSLARDAGVNRKLVSFLSKFGIKEN